MSERSKNCVCGSLPRVRSFVNTRGEDWAVNCSNDITCHQYAGPMRRTREKAIEEWNNVVDRLRAAGRTS